VFKYTEAIGWARGSPYIIPVVSNFFVPCTFLTLYQIVILPFQDCPAQKMYSR